ncbi:hypothetical protein [Phytobacter diazotrophicus]|uniref:hypothetical protein n=1 Tax=Phytobacter diazotrophicus TaxID=395631 RepID=UPI002FF1F58F
MRNRKAKFLFADFESRVRISNRRVAICIYGSYFKQINTIATKRSAAQNRWKNHCYRVESKGAQS